MTEPIYTVKLHAQRLLELLELPRWPRSQYACPAQKELMSIDPEEYKDLCQPVCDICALFVNTNGCPCIMLGKQEAIKRTWLALEEGGFI